MHASDEPIMGWDVATADVDVTQMQKNYKCSLSELKVSKHSAIVNRFSITLYYFHVARSKFSFVTKWLAQQVKFPYRDMAMNVLVMPEGMSLIFILYNWKSHPPLKFFHIRIIRVIFNTVEIHVSVYYNFFQYGDMWPQHWWKHHNVSFVWQGVWLPKAQLFLRLCWDHILIW